MNEGKDREGNGLPADAIGVREAARILHCHVSAIYRMILGGRLTAWRVGNGPYRLSEAQVRSQIVRVKVDVPVKTQARGPSHAQACAELERLGVMRK